MGSWGALGDIKPPKIRGPPALAPWGPILVLFSTLPLFTVYRLGEMFEGNFADTCSEKISLMLMGDEKTVKRAQTVSEDPHQHEQIFSPCCRFTDLSQLKIHGARTTDGFS